MHALGLCIGVVVCGQSFRWILRITIVSGQRLSAGEIKRTPGVLGLLSSCRRMCVHACEVGGPHSSILGSSMSMKSVGIHAYRDAPYTHGSRSGGV